MLRSASGARADVSESFTSAISEQQAGDSEELSLLHTRKPSLAAPPSPVGRSALQSSLDPAASSVLELEHNTIHERKAVLRLQAVAVDP